jgi:hypothetical protein
MQRFQIEVRSRRPRDTFAPWFYVNADTEQAAIDEAMRTFRGGNPGKDVDDYTFKAGIPRLCPRCGGELLRVHRRLVDRLFSPGRYRFECDGACHWVGNLPIEGTSSTWFFLVRGFAAASIVVVVASMAFFVFTIYRDRLKDTAASAKRDQKPPMVRPADRDRKEAPGR